MNNNDVPIWEKYTLTIEEAAKYFRIGESKLRKLAEENPVPDWVMMNGNRIYSNKVVGYGSWNLSKAGHRLRFYGFNSR